MTTIETTPTPKTHTLLLKSHRTTILLYAEESDPLTQIKSQIHAHLTINAANLEALDSGIKIPNSPDEIVLAVPAANAASGTEEEQWVEVEGQDKGICTVASLGVRDCGVLAWRVVGEVGEGDGDGEGGFLVEVAGGEEEEEEEEEEGMGEDGEDGGNGSGNGYVGEEEEEEDDEELR